MTDLLKNHLNFLSIERRQIQDAEYQANASLINEKAKKAKSERLRMKSKGEDPGKYLSLKRPAKNWKEVRDEKPQDRLDRKWASDFKL